MKMKKWLELMSEDEKKNEKIQKQEEKKEENQKPKEKPWINKKCVKPVELK
jgi:hypothetical protein